MLHTATALDRGCATAPGAQGGPSPSPDPTPNPEQARKEVIVDMENLMIMQLQRFYELNRVAPQRIIFYRDGVGNAQFEMIRRNEIYSIRRACTAVGGASYRPQLIF